MAKKKDKGNYNYVAAIKAGLKPGPDGHWQSVDPTTSYFLKSKTHPTLHKEIDWFRDQGMVGSFGPATHKIVTDPTGYFGEDQLRYIPIGDFVGPSEYSHGGPHSTKNVRALQKLLKEQGYNPGAIDNAWGPKTEAALASFLKDNPSRINASIAEYLPKLPLPARAFVDDFITSQLNTLPVGKANYNAITKGDLNSRQLEALREIVRTNLKEGKTTINYSDYRTDSQYGDVGPSASSSNILKQLVFSPEYNLKTTLGQADIVTTPTDTLVVDQYNFNEGQGSSIFNPFAWYQTVKNIGMKPSLYTVPRKLASQFGSQEGEGAPVMINTTEYSHGGEHDPSVYNSDLTNYSTLLPEITLTDSLPTTNQAYLGNLKRTNPIAYAATTAQNRAGQTVTDVANWLPFTGEAIDAGYTADALEKGNYGEAALYGAGFMLPFIPGKSIKEGFKKLFKKSPSSPNPDLETLSEVNKFSPNQNVGIDNITYTTSPDVTYNRLIEGTFPGDARLFMDELSKGAKPFSDRIAGRVQELSTPRGMQRLENLYAPSLPPTLNSYHAASKASKRLNELENVSTYNQLAKDYIDNNLGFISNPAIKNSRFAQESLFDNAAYFPAGSTNYRPDLSPDKMKLQLDDKMGLGVGYVDDVSVMDHEINHFLQQGNPTVLDAELSQLTPRADIDLDDAAGQAYDYFKTGSGKKEPTSFAAGLRSTLLDKGFMKYADDGYFADVTPDQLKLAYKELSANPAYKQIKKHHPIAYSPFNKYYSQQRIFDFMDPTDKNFELLSKSLNKLPAIVPGMLGAKVAKDIITNDSSEGSLKYGGQVRSYENGGPTDPPTKKLPAYNPYEELAMPSDQISNKPIEAPYDFHANTPEGTIYNMVTGNYDHDWVTQSPQSGEITPDNIIPELMFPYGKTGKLLFGSSARGIQKSLGENFNFRGLGTSGTADARASGVFRSAQNKAPEFAGKNKTWDLTPQYNKMHSTPDFNLAKDAYAMGADGRRYVGAIPKINFNPYTNKKGEFISKLLETPVEGSTIFKENIFGRYRPIERYKYGGKMKKYKKYKHGGYPKYMASGSTVGLQGKSAEDLGVGTPNPGFQIGNIMQPLLGIASTALTGNPALGMGIGELFKPVEEQNLASAALNIAGSMPDGAFEASAETKALKEQKLKEANLALNAHAVGPYESHAMGGDSRGRIEAEGGEFFISDDGNAPISVGAGELTEVADDMYKLGGPSHAAGGMPIEAPEGYVHTKRFLSNKDLGKKYKAKNDAQVAENIAKEKAKLEAFGNSKEDIETKVRMQQQLDKELMALRDSAEQYKAMKGIDSEGKAIAKYGKYISKYKNGGLWANIHAKRKRIAAGSGEVMRKPGSKGAPTEKALKRSQAAYGGMISKYTYGGNNNRIIGDPIMPGMNFQSDNTRMQSPLLDEMYMQQMLDAQPGRETPFNVEDILNPGANTYLESTRTDAPRKYYYPPTEIKNPEMLQTPEGRAAAGMAYGGYMPKYANGGDSGQLDRQDYFKLWEEYEDDYNKLKFSQYGPAMINLLAGTPDEITIDKPVKEYEKTDFNPMLDRYLKSIEADERNLLREVSQSGLTGARKIAALTSASAKGDQEKGKATSYVEGLKLKDKGLENQYNLSIDKLTSQLDLQELMLNLQQEGQTAKQRAKGYEQVFTTRQNQFWDPLKFQATGTPHFNPGGQQRSPYTYMNGGRTRNSQNYLNSFYSNLLNNK